MKKASNQFFVPHNVFEEHRFLSQSLSAKILYVVLCKLKNRMEDKNGCFYRSITDLMRDSGLSERSIQRAKKELENNKYININRGKEAHSKERSPDFFKLNGYKFQIKKRNY